MIINRPGYRPDNRIVVSETGNGKIVASAYSEDGFALEHVVKDTQEEALLELAGKLLDRIWAISGILDESKGSTAHENVLQTYP
tara:strand:- start:415 stop:666 length:252 start_codon:yes stop_codon:yes gene_type:complete